MLDELLEYWQYTEDPANIQNGRIKYGCLKSALPRRKGESGTFPCGVFRPMCVIARYFLYEKFADLPTDEQFQKVKAVLQQWSGVCPDEQKESAGASIDGWFTSYINEYMIPDYRAKHKDAIADKVQSILQIFQRKCRSLDGLEGKEFYENDSGQNTENRLTYERIIHEAGRLGGLNCWYLTADKPLRPGDLYKPGKTQEGGRPRKNERDLLLKALAAYLLETECMGRSWRYGEQMRYTEVERSDVCGWSNMKSADWATELEKTQWWSPDGLRRQVFEREEAEVGTNYMKLRFDIRFIEEYGWDLVRLEELADFLYDHPDSIVYADMGSGKLLEEFQTGRIPLEVITAEHRRIEKLISER